MMDIEFKEVKSSSSRCFQVQNDTAAFENNVMMELEGENIYFQKPYYPICYKAACSRNSDRGWVVTVEVGDSKYICEESG